MLLMLFFGWAFTWPHWVLIGVFVFLFSSIHAIFSLLSSLIAIIPFNTTVGKVLASIVVAYHLVFAIWSVWTRLPHNDGWGVAIDIYATFVFAVTFVVPFLALWKKE